MKSISGLNFHVQGFTFKETKLKTDIELDIKSMPRPSLNICQNDHKLGVQLSIVRLYNQTFRSYMHFLHKNSLCDSEFKSLMRSLDDLPKFFKEELSCENPETMWFIIDRFI